MKTVKYGGPEYLAAVLRCDVFVYVDGCGRGWFIAFDRSVRARIPV